MQRFKRPVVLASLLLVSLLTACGWQLRGQVSLGPEIGKLYAHGGDKQLLRELKAALKRNDIVLSDRISGSDYSLQLQPLRFDRRTAAVGSQILAAEYELSMQLAYRIDQQTDKPYRDQAKANAIRSYSYDPNNTLGKDQEERILKREMRSDIIQQIMRRLALIKNDSES